MIPDINTVLEKIKILSRKKGYVYTLCMILLEDFRMPVELLHKVDMTTRLNVNEVSLLISFMIQDGISFDYPADPRELVQMKKETHDLFDELHKAVLKPMLENVADDIQTEHQWEKSIATTKIG